MSMWNLDVSDTALIFGAADVATADFRAFFAAKEGFDEEDMLVES